MASAFDRGDERDVARPKSGAEPGPPGAHILEQILAQTSDSATPLEDSEDLRALIAVAHQFAGQPLTLDPVAVELIHAVLGVQLARAQLPGHTIKAMARYIAATLYGDPLSRQRLELLWARLSSR